MTCGLIYLISRTMRYRSAPTNAQQIRPDQWMEEAAGKQAVIKAASRGMDTLTGTTGVHRGQTGSGHVQPSSIHSAH